MEKKKTFQEYTKEALYEIEKTESSVAKNSRNEVYHRIYKDNKWYSVTSNGSGCKRSISSNLEEQKETKT